MTAGVGATAVPARRVGIDIGGTKAQAVVIDSSGGVIESAQRPTPRGERSLDSLVDVVNELAELVGHESSIGVGVPGLVTRSGILRAAPNLDGVADFDVAAMMSDRIGCRVYVDNDATCATVAEWVMGSGVGSRDMVMVTLGTGIGGGIVAGGVLQRGAHGFAGEFGHMVIDPSGPLCPCGRRGCWERYASGSGLALLAQEAAAGHRLGAVVRHAGGNPQAVRGEHVQAAALEGDAEALEVIDDFAKWVALGLANLTNALDPTLFVLGGGLAAASDLLHEPIQRWFGELLYQPHLRLVPRIEFATWGPLAGAIGAALLPELAR